MHHVWVLHGPNLNLLGTREPDIYGTQSLLAINEKLKETAEASGITLAAFQTNQEGDFIERIHQASAADVDIIIINAAAWTHTSIAIRDALLATSIPYIEVHLSNLHAREPWRQHSYLSDKALGIIQGFGPESYYLALSAAISWLNTSIEV